MAYTFKTFEEQLQESRTRGYGTPGTGVQPIAEPSTAPQPVKVATSGGLATPTTTAPAPAPAPAQLGTTPAPKTTTAAAAAPKPLGGYTAPAPLAVTPGPSGSKPTIQIRPYGGSTEGGAAGVLRRLREGLQKIPGQLQESATKFTEAAGPYRTWEGIGGRETIAGALRPAAGTLEDLEPARALVGARYEGPEGLDLEDLATLQEATGELQARAAGLESVGGLESALAEETVGLTPGELAFEATRMRENPQFREEALGARQDVARLEAELARASGEAGGIAGARRAQEEDIAGQARGQLTGEEEAITGDLARRMAEAEARDEGIIDAYTRFQETGDLGALEEIQTLEGALQGFTPEEFRTEARQLTEEGLAEREAIMGKYQDLSDVPLLTLQTTSKGRETLGFPEEWYQEAKKKYSKDELEGIRARATERQKELEAAGFAGGKYSKGRYTSVLPEETVGARGGKYGLVLPLYFGEDYQLPDVRTYTGLDIGVRPSRENLSSEEQRGVYNRVQDLLGQADRIAEAGEPYRGASVAAEVKRYLDEEAAELESRKTELTAAQKEWFGLVRKARKGYEKAKRSALWGKVARVALGVGTLGGSEAFRATGLPGSQVAEKALAGAMQTGYEMGSKPAKGVLQKVGAKKIIR